MFLPFNELPKTARIWIYQSSRNLSDLEVASMSNELTTFCEGWSAHAKGLKSSFQLLYNRFIIMAVDEDHHMATGCSIDSSVNLIKAFENKYNLDFMDRTKVAFLIDNELFIEPLSSVKSKVNEGLILPETKTFNNLVGTVEDFNSSWVVPSGNSWLKRYF